MATIPDQSSKKVMSQRISNLCKVLSAEHLGINKSLEGALADGLESADRPEQPTKLGTLLAEIRDQLGGIDLEIARDKTPVEPISVDRFRF